MNWTLIFNTEYSSQSNIAENFTTLFLLYHKEERSGGTVDPQCYIGIGYIGIC